VYEKVVTTEVRKATKADASAVESLRRDLRNPKPITELGGIVLVATMDERVVATSEVVPRGDDIAEIGQVVVSADYRNHGIGSMLMHKTHECAADMKVEATELLATVQSDIDSGSELFYRELGYQRIERPLAIKAKNGTTVTMVRMRRSLDDET
jgi:N-acetylglutamate synthase-like GNAT family acetyltransferase